MKLSILRYICCISLLGMVVFQSCQKKEETGVDPYAGGKAALGINFLSDRTDPEIGLPGEIIRVAVRGLKKYEGQFEFQLNGVKTEIVALSDSTLDFRIPDEVSSGFLTVVLNDQFFNGPRVAVEGKVAVDTDYQIVNGFDFNVREIVPHSGGHLVVGAFSNFEDEATEAVPISGIHFLNSLGQSAATSMAFGRGAGRNESISTITRLPSGKFFIGGSLNEYNRRDVNGIARLNANGSLDTMVVAVINPDAETKPLNGLDTVSAFNAGFDMGIVTHVFPAADDGAYVVGSFNRHVRIDYAYSSRENRREIFTNVRNIAKVHADGTLDETFNRDNTGLNGFVNGAIQLTDGRLVVVGGFTNYNGRPVNNIVCIKPDGEVDETFTAGGGANREIQSITFNKNTGKIAIAGNFNTYRGTAVKGVVLLNEEGQVDTNFQLGNLEGGTPSYAYSLTNGKVLITGAFTKYNGVDRGLLILEPDGTAKQEYNNLGFFAGSPNTLVETTSSLGNPAILLGGFIFAVDGIPAGNIVKIEIKD